MKPFPVDTSPFNRASPANDFRRGSIHEPGASIFQVPHLLALLVAAHRLATFLTLQIVRLAGDPTHTLIPSLA